MYTQGLRLNDLMGALGLPGGWAGYQADMLSGNYNNKAMLKNLRDAYNEAAMGRGTDRWERVMSGGKSIPPFGAMPPPSAAMGQNGPLCGCGYHGYQKIDLAGGDGSKRFAAMKLERFLKNPKNAASRAAFEQSIGGRIVGFGRTDGKLLIERFPPGAAPIPGFAENPLAMSAVGSMHGMEQAVMKHAMKMGLITSGVGAGVGALSGLGMGAMMGNPLMGLLMGGFGGLLSGAGMGMGFMGMGMPMMGLGMGGFGALPFLGGAGMGSWNPNAMPGRVNNTNPIYERAHQAQVAGVLHDPSLTVEDKVTLMLMLIMKKMDRDIERQAQYINSIQQQQSNRQKKSKGLGALGTVAGGALGGPAGAKLGGGVGGKLGGGGNSPSIDVETMKLKRMIDKRGQMFDMLRQIIDKYNETAKGIIQSIGR